MKVPAGRVDVLHRLALAVQLVDSVTRLPVWRGPDVGRETAWSVAAAHLPPRRGRTPVGPAIAFDRHSDSSFLLRHESRVVGNVTIRVSDRSRTWVPRRISLPLWSLDEVSAADQVPPTGAFVPTDARLLRAWLLPGQAYPLPRGATGFTARVMRDGMPVRWARVEAFTTPGRVGWGHGDEHGQVLVVLTERPAFPAPGTKTFQVAVRVHGPDPQAVPPMDPIDPLADLPTEAVPRSSNPPTAQDLDSDLLRGLRRPASYVTANDEVKTLSVGTVTHLGDITFSP